MEMEKSKEKIMKIIRNTNGKIQSHDFKSLSHYEYRYERILRFLKSFFYLSESLNFFKELKFNFLYFDLSTFIIRATSIFRP